MFVCEITGAAYFYLLDLEEPWDTDQGALFERDHGGGLTRIYLFS